MRKATYKTAATAAALLVVVAGAWPLLHGRDARAAEAVIGQPGLQADTGSTASAAQQANKLPPSPGWYPQPKGTPIQGHDTLTAAEVAIQLTENATQGPAQPIPFNHRFHVTNLDMSCTYCHTNSRHSEVAIVPPLATCMGCHGLSGAGRQLTAIDSLKAYYQRKQPVEWNRVYKIAEFVQFKHEPHLRNNIQCQDCHGPVQDMDRIYKFQSDTIVEKALTMGWCLNCHRQKPQSTDVSTEYKLVRQATIPEEPGGSERPGLYPIRIDQHYAAHRAPVDCATCHY